MLAKAVKEHKPAGPATLSQQLFPSNSSTVGHPSSSSIVVQESSRVKGSATNVLKPASPSALNSSLPKPGKHHTNPLKRRASEMTSDSHGLPNQERGRSFNSSATSGRESVVGKLHDTVYFDENDFVDDDDLNLDFPESLPEIDRQTAHLKQHTLTQKSTPLNEKHLASSVPIPWSSSPLDHHTATITYPTLPKLSPEPDSDAEGNQAKIEAPRTTKRRTLPWMVVQDETAAKSETEPKSNRSGPPDFVKDILDRQKKKHRSVVHAKEAVTPASKDNEKSPHPWNKTASAIKEEQKKHRQQANQGKKMIKDAKGEESIDTTGKKKKTKSSKKAAHRVFLSEEQKKVLDLVVDAKKSVFFTGSAGTGKSVLMREIIKVLRTRFHKEPDRVAVTASTGLAACNVGGVTLHSFSGIGLGKEPAEELVKKIKKNAKAKNRWMRTQVLIIDEISMVDGDLFDKLERIARMIRSNGRPFGGIQLVVTGDFFQLPPVPDYGKVAKFCFEAGTWGTSIEHTIGLTQVFRQKDPSEYSAISVQVHYTNPNQYSRAY